MNILRSARAKTKMSQRALAARAGLSFGAVQRLEWGSVSPRWSTLVRVCRALGFDSENIEAVLARHLSAGSDSVAESSLSVAREGERAWAPRLFNFVDAFRRTGDRALVSLPPAPEASLRVQALFAGTVEALCAERGLRPPDWCRGVGVLDEPWFPSEVENLKAAALVQSPVFFRRRGIFVLANFLERA